MSQEKIRKTRIENLNKSQSARKEDALSRVYQAIKRLEKIGGKINFHTLAKEANVSVSYLYKYPELKQHIAELRSKQSSMPVSPVNKPVSSKSHSQVVGRLKERLSQLEEQNYELRRKNEALAGQVYRVHYLQEQVERQQQTIEDLQARLKEAFAPTPTAKVTPIAQAKSLQVSDLLQEELETSGVELTKSLKRIICEHDEETVLMAIKAFKQYKKTNYIEFPAKCLRQAIVEGWKPNQASDLQPQQISSYKPPVYTAPEESSEELVSPEQIQDLMKKIK